MGACCRKTERTLSGIDSNLDASGDADGAKPLSASASEGGEGSRPGSGQIKKSKSKKQNIDDDPFVILGDSVMGKTGDVPVSEILGKNRIVGLYFSAHWCPPCRGFTPLLVDWYELAKAKDSVLKDKLEIVFISSDNGKSSFDSYYEEMPWLALQYEKRDEKDRLGDMFSVRGIPFLVFLRGDGEVITKNGRDMVTSGSMAVLTQFAEED